jgi:hypothetical protein
MNSKQKMTARDGSKAAIKALSAAVLVVFSLAATTAVAADAKADAKVVKKKKAKKFPIGGQVSLGVSAGLGTFVAGEQNRASLGSTLSMFFLMPVPMVTGLRFAMANSISKTFVNFAEDPFAPRARNTSIGDVLVLFLYTPTASSSGPQRKLTEAEKAAAALNPSLATGGGKPIKLPGGIGMQFQAGFTLPFSKTAKFQTRYTIARVAANFMKTLGGVNFLYQFRFDKRFNQYSNWVADYSQIDGIPLSRDGEAEDIDSQLVATGNVNIAYTFRNRFMATKSFGKLSVQANYSLANNFSEYSSPIDEFSGEYAKEGRGRLDLAFASLALNYGFGGGWNGSVSTQTWSAPWGSDGTTLRIPFFDPRYASNNITSLNLSIAKGF